MKSMESFLLASTRTDVLFEYHARHLILFGKNIKKPHNRF